MRWGVSTENCFVFSKKKFFQNFNRSNLFLDRSKLQLKFWLGSVCFDRCLIGVGSVEALSINRTYFSISWKSYREFFKTFVSHVFCHFQAISKTLFSLYSISPSFLARFLSFSSKFLQGFFSSFTDKTFLPFFFHLFWFFMHLRDIFGPMKNWGFWCF